MSIRWQFRRDTAATWTSRNPILRDGEIGIELHDKPVSDKIKIGDGVTPWVDLDYFAPGGTGGGVTSVNGQTGAADLDANDVGADPAGTGSEAAIAARAYAIQREHHSGFQTASTISDFDDAVDALVGEAVSTAGLTIFTQTGTSYTAVLTDAGQGRLTALSNASPITYTIPPNSTTGFPVGAILNAAVLGAGQATITPGSGVTFIGGSYKSARQGALWSAIQVTTNTWLINGDLTT